MAGQNKFYKANQIVFSKGDDSNGMFLVRSGELCVFLEKDEKSKKEIVLAQIKPGGMIGEMALFDNRPRSASVKAIKDSELTHITQKDFDKLVKQIPKWFSALMSALSTRLRDTNDRVQELSDKLERYQEQSNPSMQNLSFAARILKEVNNVMQKSGVKSGAHLTGYKAFEIDKTLLLKELSSKMKVNPNDFSKVFKGLASTNLAKETANAIVTENKSSLARFVSFLEEYLAKAKVPSLTEPAMEILEFIAELAEASIYDNFSVSYKQLKEQGSVITHKFLAKWDDHFFELEKLGEEIKSIRSGDELGFRVMKKEFAILLKHHRALFELCKSVSS